MVSDVRGLQFRSVNGLFSKTSSPSTYGDFPASIAARIRWTSFFVCRAPGWMNVFFDDCASVTWAENSNVMMYNKKTSGFFILFLILALNSE